MPPFLALFIWFILLAGLLCFDPARSSKTSAALWVPVIWLFIVGSRLPSQWLGGQVTTTGAAFEEGNPLDRTIYLVLILLTLGILASRSFKWGDFFARNRALTALLLFGLTSVLWSDFPFVAFKRWFRDLGTYLVILVALSDTRPLEAVHTVLRRVCYLLIPLSIVIDKYYPEIGKQYDSWTGVAYYAGAATSKNMLGVMCLISGLFFFWDTITRWSDRKEWRTKRIILVNVAFMAMALFLLTDADSATSRVCLVLGCLVIVAAQSKTFQRHPAFLKGLIPTCISVCVIVAFSFNINAELAEAVGRDSTFTGRTVIWSAVLSMHTNPLVGCGYESFWLGPRLNQVWAQTGPGINEAHNGYIEVYLTLGLLGLVVLGVFLVVSYRTICMSLRSTSSFGSLALALWTMLLFYNVTESAFRGQLVWAIFLLASIAVTLCAPRMRSASHPEGPPFEEPRPEFREAITI